ncbi:VOC family protein [Anaerocolumna sp. AGMB13025]|uniref:VOC family protein n=1 Tax=Anaerocolumna sp. AGMB13025 TaxID=3039116 RepID=UPI00241D8638|nr:VOC family protein [Anaerocolumna sp. AGMB13025]WFR55759.1 VOC family protein [Anaerocolumna sp. AGMB13025]
MKHVDTIVLVEDIKVSKEFYANIMGLEILSDWGNMVIFKERFSIHQADKLMPEQEIQKLLHNGKQGYNNVDIYFETENIEEEYHRLIQKEVKIIHGIIELPWQKIFRIYDPDNHIIEIGGPHN